MRSSRRSTNERTHRRNAYGRVEDVWRSYSARKRLVHARRRPHRRHHGAQRQRQIDVPAARRASAAAVGRESRRDSRRCPADTCAAISACSRRNSRSRPSSRGSKTSTSSRACAAGRSRMTKKPPSASVSASRPKTPESASKPARPASASASPSPSCSQATPTSGSSTNRERTSTRREGKPCGEKRGQRRSEGRLC